MIDRTRQLYDPKVVVRELQVRVGPKHSLGRARKAPPSLCG